MRNLGTTGPAGASSGWGRRGQEAGQGGATASAIYSERRRGPPVPDQLDPRVPAHRGAVGCDAAAGFPQMQRAEVTQRGSEPGRALPRQAGHQGSNDRQALQVVTTHAAMVLLAELGQRLQQVQDGVVLAPLDEAERTQLRVLLNRAAHDLRQRSACEVQGRRSGDRRCQGVH